MSHRPWFRPKAAPGWGVSPASWEGWALTLGCVLAGVALTRLLRPELGVWAWAGLLPPLLVLFGAIAISGKRQGWTSLQRKADDR